MGKPFPCCCNNPDVCCGPGSHYGRTYGWVTERSGFPGTVTRTERSVFSSVWIPTENRYQITILERIWTRNYSAWNGSWPYTLYRWEDDSPVEEPLLTELLTFDLCDSNKFCFEKEYDDGGLTGPKPKYYWKKASLPWIPNTLVERRITDGVVVFEETTTISSFQNFFREDGVPAEILYLASHSDPFQGIDVGGTGTYQNIPYGCGTYYTAPSSPHRFSNRPLLLCLNDLCTGFDNVATWQQSYFEGPDNSEFNFIEVSGSYNATVVDLMSQEWCPTAQS